MVISARNHHFFLFFPQVQAMKQQPDTSPKLIDPRTSSISEFDIPDCLKEAWRQFDIALKNPNDRKLLPW